MSQYTVYAPCASCQGWGWKVGIIPGKMERCDHGAREAEYEARGRVIDACLSGRDATTHSAKEE